MSRDSSPVESPCTKVCRIDPQTGWCQGCLRRLDEIAAWGRSDDAARRALAARLDERRATAAGQATLARGHLPVDSGAA